MFFRGYPYNKRPTWYLGSILGPRIIGNSQMCESPGFKCKADSRLPRVRSRLTSWLVPRVLKQGRLLRTAGRVGSDFSLVSDPDSDGICIYIQLHESTGLYIYIYLFIYQHIHTYLRICFPYINKPLSADLGTCILDSGCVGHGAAGVEVRARR